MEVAGSPNTMTSSVGRQENGSFLRPALTAKTLPTGKNNIVPGRTSGSGSVFGGGRRPWWNLCFVHGDQTKYYRQLYGKRRVIRTLAENSCQCSQDGQSTLQRKQQVCKNCKCPKEDHNTSFNGLTGSDPL